MTEVELRQAIAGALKRFQTEPLSDAATHLWDVLGYASKKRLALKPNTLSTFLSMFSHGRALNDLYAKPDDWKSVDFLFQLTDEEVRTSANQQFNFESKGAYNGSIINSYLFFAIELKGSHYSRTTLAGITREVNKLFDMPALILFRHGETLTLAIINRRLHKREAGKDVLEKVTLIQDIQLTHTHRAHIDILADLSLSVLHRRHPFTNFVGLHEAWQKTLDTSELNKRFFQDLANWYFWALPQVRFPKNAPKDADGQDSLSLIRLITRVIFCWFLKEKGLLPEALFDEYAVPALLADLSPKESTYYKAILQNLFFATLNQEMDKREFRKSGQNFMAHNLYRYKNLLKSPDETLTLFEEVPFMNGGLFECLDKTLGTKEKPQYIRVDGFSDRDDNILEVPNDLFWGSERVVDLSDFYGENRYRSSKVAGLVRIFNRYKFTVAENTPIEEEVALDPELLGRVFENLLAAYNPETGATARKQTGSFYTPREIVNYMVDESLIASLKSKLAEVLPKADRTEKRLRQLFAYNDHAHEFEESEVIELIKGIDKLTILDPACGSGAFPMGILHKLVFVLSKLDRGNQRWKAQQIAKANELTDSTVREFAISQIEQAFQGNELDYGRKLYLIENCIYGVDIQPIAVQISKLRFFISLVVEQTVHLKTENRGIRPLPNLETKFVAANTLIGVQRPGQQLLRDLDVQAKEAELHRVRERHFLARTPATKAKYRDEDARLRSELAEMLKNDGWNSGIAKMLAAWDPYDQNASAPFFDTEWMFGMTLGFDVVIANPPYIDSETMTINQPESRVLYSRLFSTAKGNWDLFVVFIEQGLRLLAEHGVIAFIVPNKLVGAPYAEAIRELLRQHAILEIRDYSSVRVFKEADVYPVVFRATVDRSLRCAPIMAVMNGLEEVLRQRTVEVEKFYSDISWDRYFGTNRVFDVVMKIAAHRPLQEQCKTVGAAATVSEAYEIKEFIREVTAVSGNKFKKFVNTGTIDRFVFRWGKKTTRYIKDGYDVPVVLNTDLSAMNPKRLAQADAPKIIIGGMTKVLECALDDSGIYMAGKSTTLVLDDDVQHLKFLLGVLNSKIVTFWYRNYYKSLTLAGGYLRINQGEIKTIPLPKPSVAAKQRILDLVDSIINAAEDGSSIERLDAVLEQEVAALYGLDDDEFAVVLDHQAEAAHA